MCTVHPVHAVLTYSGISRCPRWHYCFSSESDAFVLFSPQCTEQLTNQLLVWDTFLGVVHVGTSFWNAVFFASRNANSFTEAKTKALFRRLFVEILRAQLLRKILLVTKYNRKFRKPSTRFKNLKITTLRTQKLGPTQATNVQAKNQCCLAVNWVMP